LLELSFLTHKEAEKYKARTSLVQAPVLHYHFRFHKILDMQSLAMASKESSIDFFLIFADYWEIEDSKSIDKYWSIK